ncbi:MAG: site-specific DNA-methyltransferase [Chloroflexi bacterium]|nr:site-specific DNA-methyltransferase [Chloroflexota bacterium]
MARRRGSRHPTQVESLKHRDTRKNIPTEELRDFAPDEPADVVNALRWPRDPALDPQFVWQGKDDLDAEDLTVPVVPIYIQEKLHPHAIIEDLRRTSQNEATYQLDWFDDFNGLDNLQHKLEFYQHDQYWQNRLILGDSLLVMASLADKEGLRGKIQCIYMDPPYGVKFNSNWQVSTRRREVRDGRAQDTTRQPEQVRAFRDTWKLGVNSYLTYLRDRLTVARDLLSDTGSIFVQIGDENVHRVRAVLDEVFGAENHIAKIVVAKTSSQTSQHLAGVVDYVLFYARNRESLKYRQLNKDKKLGEKGTTQYVWQLSNDLQESRISKNVEPEGHVFAAGDLRSQSGGATTQFGYDINGITYHVYRGGWKTNLEGMNRLERANRIKPIGKSLMYRRFLDDFAVYPIANLWDDVLATGFSERKVYVVQSSQKLVQRCVLMATDPGDLVLDPTCGSGTTAYVAEQWGRRWITIDTSRVALALARTRLMAARYPYYLLLDSAEGHRKESEIGGQPAINGKTSGDIRQGFVYERAPHIQLRDIARNEEIDEIWHRWQPKVKRSLAALNLALRGHSTGFVSPVGGRIGEIVDFSADEATAVALPCGELARSNELLEWEVPRDPPSDWPADARGHLEEFWCVRISRLQEIDDSIARSVRSEVLYDRPFEDPTKIRVAGPFTVESLSPHRMLAVDDPPPSSVRVAEEDPHQPDFTASIIENLAKAGVQNTRRSQRLRFTRLEPVSGDPNLHAEGEYTDASGDPRRVAVSIGPEHGTVGAEQIGRAARAAVRGVGYDLLVVCGFAFDAHADEKALEFAPQGRDPEAFAVADAEERYGRLPVMLARMNPDLSMGDDLLKKTGAGNLFTVFGEPDVHVERTDDGQVVVELHGVDVYDPTSGVVRSASTKDIACWFIDTRYDEQSFFVRHAYFTGAGDPYKQLKRSLRAEIDPDAWASLYQTRSRPFPPPTTGRIAIKVINHYGDEVLKVYEIDDRQLS